MDLADLGVQLYFEQKAPEVWFWYAGVKKTEKTFLFAQVGDQIIHAWDDKTRISISMNVRQLEEMYRRRVWSEQVRDKPHHVERGKPDGDA
jgi:hypothetical protein